MSFFLLERISYVLYKHETRYNGSTDNSFVWTSKQKIKPSMCVAVLGSSVSNEKPLTCTACERYR